MPKRTPRSDPAAVAAYLDAAREPARSRLHALVDAVRAEAPEALERIAYGLATWHHGENLIHLGAFQHHVGVYPGAAAIVAFAEELNAFKTSKGAIQIPHDAPLPVALVRRITRWRLEQAATNATPRASKRRTRDGHAVTGPADIAAYDASQSLLPMVALRLFCPSRNLTVLSPRNRRGKEHRHVEGEASSSLAGAEARRAS
jgi:uncharacterized protein YdhG (YjbR/CyaY superfamily)